MDASDRSLRERETLEVLKEKPSWPNLVNETDKIFEQPPRICIHGLTFSSATEWLARWATGDQLDVPFLEACQLQDLFCGQGSNIPLNNFSFSEVDSAREV